MRTIFDTLEEVPEFLRDKAVKQADGTFLVEGNGLADKNKELLGLNAKYKSAFDKLQKFGDTDPEKAMAAFKEMQKIEQRQAELDAEIQKAVQTAGAEWQGKLTKEQAASAKLRATVEKYLVDNVLTDEITKAKGNPTFVAHHLRSSIQVVEENGEFKVKVIDPATKGAAFNAKGEAKTIADLVSEAKADQRFKGAFEAPAASGSGSAASGQQATEQGGKVIRLSRADALNPTIYREKLKESGNRPELIQVEQ